MFTHLTLLTAGFVAGTCCTAYHLTRDHALLWGLTLLTAGFVGGACYTAYLSCRYGPNGPIVVFKPVDDVFTPGGADRPRRQEHHGADSRTDFHLWN